MFDCIGRAALRIAEVPAQTREACTHHAERLEERVSQLALFLAETSAFAPKKQAATSQNQVTEEATTLRRRSKINFPIY